MAAAPPTGARCRCKIAQAGFHENLLADSQRGESFEMGNHLIQELFLVPQQLRDDVDKGRMLPVA